MLNVVTLGLQAVHVTETKRGESLKQYRLRAGDVMVGEQGYCSYAGLLHTVEQPHADVLVRWNHPRALSDPDAPKRGLDCCTTLKPQAPGTLVRRPGVLKDAETRQTQDPRTLSGPLHIYRMQEKEAQAARKKVSKRPRKWPRKLSAKPRCLRQCVCVFTSLSSQVLGGETALALYRWRWHIALAMKSMKSLSHLDTRRAKQCRKRAEVAWYRKIISPLLVDHARRTTFGVVWGSLDQARQGTWWRFSKLLTARCEALLLAHWTWEAMRVRAGLHGLLERPRKRTLQGLPRRVVALQQRLNALSQAA